MQEDLIVYLCLTNQKLYYSYTQQNWFLQLYKNIVYNKKVLVPQQSSFFIYERLTDKIKSSYKRYLFLVRIVEGLTNIKSFE